MAPSISCPRAGSTALNDAFESCPAVESCPKVELHCHLLGVITPRLLEQVRAAGAPILVEPQSLSAVYPVRGADGFRRFVEVLRPYHSAPPETMRPILAAHVRSLREQHVVYTELMISPAMFGPGGLLTGFQKWREWSLEMEEGQIQIEFLMVVPRSLSPEALERDTAGFIELRRRDLIVGVALAGPEAGESIDRFETAFLRWRDEGLGIEIHAGEHSGPESVWDALRHGRPDRLGHALSAFQDSELIDYLRASRLHIEFCPTSNLCTGAVESMERHPIGRARQAGLNFSVNTDDPGAFECSLSAEYGRVAGIFGFSSSDFSAIFRQSLSARFARNLRHPDTIPHWAADAIH
jgi:aminodeoxyfutalosine deaminase